MTAESISIALTTYNGKPYIEKQLDSLISQTLPADEIIVCDDGSTDGTREILGRYGAEHPGRFRLFFNSANLGYVGNFEYALSLTGGGYLLTCDQDDIWEKNKIAELVRRINDSWLIHHDAVLIDKNGKALSPSFTKLVKKRVRPSFYDLFFLNSVTGCACMFRRELLRHISSFPKNVPHDWWLALTAVRHHKLEYLPEPLIYYRQHDANLIGSGQRGGKKLVSHLREIRHFFRRRKKVIRFAYENVLQNIPDPPGDARFLRFRRDLEYLYALTKRRTITLRPLGILLFHYGQFRSLSLNSVLILTLNIVFSWLWP
jgi:glycosyltransferase involved in cell wall biosynthesis